MKVSYLSKNLGQETRHRIDQATKIIDEYQSQGFTLTVRQIYYQFITRNWIANKKRSYKLIANALEKGRMNGLIDWRAIEDRTRFLRGNDNWESPPDFLQDTSHRYRLDSRADQTFRIEVWIEKDALIGIIGSICLELDVDYFSCRGYVSLSEMWRAARRYQYDEDRTCVILHLGDHDPSGLDMTRVIRDTLLTFGCTNIEVRRIALNMEQIEEYQPPPNFIKPLDTRSDKYVEMYGKESWELDALSPQVMVDLIKENVDRLTNKAKRQRRIELQEKQKAELQDVLESAANDWEGS